jgi:hypothetical protein
MMVYYLGEISGSYGDRCEDDSLLGCCTVQPGRSLSKFQRGMLPPSSGR